MSNVESVEEFAALPIAANVPLLQLVGNKDDALGRAAKRVIHDLDDSDGAISAFQSFTS